MCNDNLIHILFDDYFKSKYTKDLMVKTIICMPFCALFFEFFYEFDFLNLIYLMNIIQDRSDKSKIGRAHV